jgi:hypothetical protein
MQSGQVLLLKGCQVISSMLPFRFYTFLQSNVLVKTLRFTSVKYANKVMQS